MRFILAFIACCFMVSSVVGQESNPRLKNFRYGTGKASWWGTPSTNPAPQVFYYPSAVRYYQPYYARHFNNCYCYTCIQYRQRMMMYQWRMNQQRFFFQFRF